MTKVDNLLIAIGDGDTDPERVYIQEGDDWVSTSVANIPALIDALSAARHEYRALRREGATEK